MPDAMKDNDEGILSSAFYALFPTLRKSKKQLDQAGTDPTGAEAEKAKDKKKERRHSVIIQSLPKNSPVRKNYEETYGKKE